MKILKADLPDDPSDEKNSRISRRRCVEESPRKLVQDPVEGNRPSKKKLNDSNQKLLAELNDFLLYFSYFDHVQVSQ